MGLALAGYDNVEPLMRWIAAHDCLTKIRVPMKGVVPPKHINLRLSDGPVGANEAEVVGALQGRGGSATLE